MLWRSWEDLGFLQAWEHLQCHQGCLDGCFPFHGTPQENEEGLKEQRCPWSQGMGTCCQHWWDRSSAGSLLQGRSTKTPARGADPSSLPTLGFRVINPSDPMCRCWEGRPVPPPAASSLFACSNPQPFEQIIKIHLYLICLLELIEFLRLANVSGCTLPPNGGPAAGAAGTARGSQHSPGINPTLEQGTGRPQAPLARVTGWQHPASSAGMLNDTRQHPPNLPVEGGSPNPTGFPLWCLWRGHGDTLSPFPTAVPEMPAPCLGR